MRTVTMIGTVAAMAGLVLATEARAAWTDTLKIGGDLRVRIQRDMEDDKDDRDRVRVRARIGVDAQVNEFVRANVRLASGMDRDPISDNQTLTGRFDKKDFNINRAYLRVTPFEGLDLIAGKMDQPWIAVNDLVMSADAMPEGLAAKGKLALSPMLDAMVSASYMIYEENKTDTDVTLSTGQGALKIKPMEGKDAHLLVGGGVFLWDGLTVADPTAQEYTSVEGFAEVRLPTPIPVTVMGQYVVNTDADDDDTGYLAGLLVGKAKDPGAFEVGYQYRYLEKHCVMPALAENTDTGNGTDVRAHIGFIRYVLAKNFDAKLNVALAEKGLEDGVDRQVVKLDFSAKF